jgi:hypothetical protein
MFMVIMIMVMFMTVLVVQVHGRKAVCCLLLPWRCSGVRICCVAAAIA